MCVLVAATGVLGLRVAREGKGFLPLGLVLAFAFALHRSAVAEGVGDLDVVGGGVEHQRRRRAGPCDRRSPSQSRLRREVGRQISATCVTRLGRAAEGCARRSWRRGVVGGVVLIDGDAVSRQPSWRRGRRNEQALKRIVSSRRTRVRF
jgi:hypothetical protein